MAGPFDALLPIRFRAEAGCRGQGTVAKMRKSGIGPFQRTLQQPVRFSGIGLHSGSTITMTLSPAPADHGIVFVRGDRKGEEAVIAAAWDNVVDTRMCTVLGNRHGVTVGTVEHIMGALRGCEIDNAVVKLDGPEIAIMDGSAALFIEAIDSVGTVEQGAPRQFLRILKPVTVREGNKSATLLPAERPGFAFEIDFESAAIRRQSASFELDGAVFRDDIGQARTFGFLHEVDALRRMGLARGGSLDNAIVISGEDILNEEGLRYSDEFVRHKILDAVGDLYLAGAPILGRFAGVRSGHALNNRLLHALFADSSAWCWDSSVPARVAPAWTGELRRAVA
jgi:UDP-3-O-[3-hydroxymyristoyl] N-acetylglucosamine deacetylase